MKRYLKQSGFGNGTSKSGFRLGTSQAGDLFCAFSKRTRKGYTTFHKSLNKLVDAKLVDSHIENRGKMEEHDNNRKTSSTY